MWIQSTLSCVMFQSCFAFLQQSLLLGGCCCCRFKISMGASLCFSPVFVPTLCESCPLCCDPPTFPSPDTTGAVCSRVFTTRRVPAKGHEPWKGCRLVKGWSGTSVAGRAAADWLLLLNVCLLRRCELSWCCVVMFAGYGGRLTSEDLWLLLLPSLMLNSKYLPLVL